MVVAVEEEEEEEDRRLAGTRHLAGEAVVGLGAEEVGLLLLQADGVAAEQLRQTPSVQEVQGHPLQQVGVQEADHIRPPAVHGVKSMARPVAAAAAVAGEGLGAFRGLYGPVDLGKAAFAVAGCRDSQSSCYWLTAVDMIRPSLVYIAPASDLMYSCVCNCDEHGSVASHLRKFSILCIILHDNGRLLLFWWCLRHQPTQAL